MLTFNPTFHSPLLPSSRGSSIPLHFLPFGCCYLRLLVSLPTIYIQFSSDTQSCLTLCNPMDWSTAGVPVHLPVQLLSNSQSWLKLMSIELMMPNNHFILCHPLLHLPSIFPSIRVFSNESVLWPKYWSFSFNINLSNEHSGLILFRMDWLDLFAVQETLKSLLQHHSSKASII